MSQLIQDTHNLSDNIQNRIAKLIKFAREKQNLSQDYIAKESGLSVKTIKRAEKGDDLVIDTLLRICSILGLSFDLLFYVYNTSNISEILILLEEIVATELSNYDFCAERNQTIAFYFHINREFSVLLDDINFQNRTNFASIKEINPSLFSRSKTMFHLFFGDSIERCLSIYVSNKQQETNAVLKRPFIAVSQEKFAELANISLDTVKQYLNCRMLKASSLLKISSIYKNRPNHIQQINKLQDFFTLLCIGYLVSSDCA